MKTEKKPRYKKRAECSNELQELIDLVNILPEGAKLPDFDSILRKLNIDNEFDLELAKMIGGLAFDLMSIKATNIWEAQIKALINPKDFKLLIKFFNKVEHSLKPTDLEISEGIRQFERICELFEQVLKLSKNFKSNFWIYENYFPLSKDFEASFVTLTASGKEGAIKFQLPEFLKPFKDCELIRFRRCLICNRIFYAKKTNADTCGKKACASTLYNKKRLAKIKAEKDKRKLERERFKNQDFSKKENKK